MKEALPENGAMEVAESEAAEVIASFPAFLETQRKLKMEEIENDEERLAAYRDVTEYQFLITHYVASHEGDPPALQEMWKALRSIAGKKEDPRNFSPFQRGVVTQVATHKIFKKLGFAPHLSHPEEDAFKKIDLWSDENHAVQVKGTAEEQFDIFETDKIGPAPVEVSGKDGKTRKLFDSALRTFRTKLKSFGTDVTGYFIVIPSKMINFETGEPSDELVELVHQKIGPGHAMKEAA
jgi:hypothetical protein